MDKRGLLDKAARTEDERLLLGQVWDRYEQCRSRNIPAHTAFLSPAEAAAARRLLAAMGVEDGFAFYGGYEGAERTQLHFLPDWAAGPEETLRAIRCTWYREDKLTHRDLLGGLMGLGIVREAIGDILVDENAADILAADTVAGFLLENWQAAGRVHLELREIPLHDLHLPQRACREWQDTVSSLRLDNVLAAGFSLSRGKAAQAVEAGRVQVNWQDCTRGDKTLSPGDTITLRGMGRMELAQVGHTTKKGRLSVTLRRYL